MDVSAPLSKPSAKARRHVAESRVLDLLALTAVDGLGDDGVANVLNQVRRCNSSLEDFYESDAEEDEQSLAASESAPGDLFAGLNFSGERRVQSGDYERMAQLVADWPPERLLDTSRPEVRDTLRRLASTAIEVFFTERFLRLTKPGGLITVIVPESIVASDRVGPLRKWLDGQMDLLAVVSLPHKVFTGVGANAKTSIIFAQRLLEPRPAGWDEADDFKNSPVARYKIFMNAPRLDVPGWNLEWYLKDVLEGARRRRDDFIRTGK